MSEPNTVPSPHVHREAYVAGRVCHKLPDGRWRPERWEDGRLNDKENATCIAAHASEEQECAWADYRKDYGVGQREMNAAHKAFMAGWQAAREGDQSGVQR